MLKSLQPHPLAALFPELPQEELKLLARDIKERGQLEPIVLLSGLILDGRNRYKACQIAGTRPWTEEFDAKSAKRSPEQFVLSRNLRRRHLTVGQKASIALEWSEQIELNPRSDKTKARGRPRGTILEAARNIGVSEQRVFEVRNIKQINLSLYKDVKAGRRSLNSALREVTGPQAQGSPEFRYAVTSSGSEGNPPNGEPDVTSAQDSKLATGGRRSPTKEPKISSQAVIEKALLRIKTILGSSFHAEVKARNLIQSTEDIVQFARLSDAQMLESGSLLRRGWNFNAAFREVKERLTPSDEIRALHTRAVENGAFWCLVSVGDFGHVVVWGAEKDKALAKVEETLAKTLRRTRLSQ